jgi:hypothetical protein
MKTYGAVEVQLYICITPRQDGIFSFKTQPLALGERVPGTPWIRG